MLLLPVSHEDGATRRLPWVSVGIFAVCFVLEVNSCAVTPKLIERRNQLQLQMLEVEEKAIAAYQETLTPEDHKRDSEEFIENLATGGSERAQNQAFEDHFTKSSKEFREGKLTAPDDPLYLEWKDLKAELDALIQKVPSMRFGYRPALDGLWRMLTSMFAHGGFLHLIGNMWFLYLVGCNLEDRWGRFQFLAFYVVAGCIAALTFTALHQESEIPLVGASGAVAGAMGAFMVCFSRTRIKIFYVYWLFMMPRWGTFRASAWVVLAVWVLQELSMTLVEVSATSTQVAHSAHAGGFLFGGIVAFLLKRAGVDSQLDQASERAADAEQTVFQEHPLYLQALDQRAVGNDAQAAALLVKLLRESPNHLGACEVLLDLGLMQGELRFIDYGLPTVFEQKQRLRAYEPLATLYRELRRTQPDYGLTDKELLGVATAAGHVKDGSLAIKAVSELMEQHPQSPLLPRAMWLAAEAQATLGALDLQRDTLERIMRRFPEHACASLARQALQRKGAVA